MTTPTARAALLLLASVTLIGCGDTNRNVVAVERDSAGVTIVESATPRWTSAQRWVIDTVPLLDLATSGAGVAHEFSDVVDAVRREDGSIVVADAGSSQVRAFNARGDLQWTLGRAGEGPAEFSRLSNLTRYLGDSIVAFDYWLGRLTVISDAGAFGRDAHAVKPGPGVERLVHLGDTTFAAQLSAYAEMANNAGLFRIPAHIVMLSAVGAILDTLTTIPGIETYLLPRGDMQPLFRRAGHMTARDGRIYTGSAEAFEYRVHSKDGRLERIVRLPGFDLSVTADEVQREREAMLGADPHPLLRDLVEQLPNPVTRPAYDQLVVDATGAVWASGSRARADTTGPTTWQLFDADGGWLGSAVLPRRLRVFEIGVDHILAVQPDSLDVEHVQLLRLTRPGRR